MLYSYSIGHLLDDFHCTDADGAASLEQVDPLRFVVGKFVGVELFANGGSFGFLFFGLVIEAIAI
jgi:hypothetical protein